MKHLNFIPDIGPFDFPASVVTRITYHLTYTLGYSVETLDTPDHYIYTEYSVFTYDVRAFVDLLYILSCPSSHTESSAE